MAEAALPPPAKPTGFTGRRRQKKTRLSVKFSDRAAAVLITVGGIGTIVAVSLVAVELLRVVYPLFLDAGAGNRVEATAPWSGGLPRELALDEYRLSGWHLTPDGEVELFRVDNGQPLHRIPLADDVPLTSFSLLEDSGSVAVGYADGTVRLGEITYKTIFLEQEDVPEALRHLKPGEYAPLGEGMVQVTPQRQFRQQELEVVLRDPISLGESPVVLLDHMLRPRGPALAAVLEDGTALFVSLRERRALVGGGVTYTPSLQELSGAVHRGAAPDHVFAPGLGDNVYAVWNDGHLKRYDTRTSETRLAEEIDLIPSLAPAGTRLTAVRFALGRETLLVGDSSGRLRAWFRVRNPDAVTSDAHWLLPVHEYDPHAAAVTALGISLRSRMVVAGYGDGRARVLHATTNNLLLDKQVAEEPIDLARIDPRDNGLLFASGSRVARYDFEPAHPEVSAHALFGAVWYEGYERPEKLWQSSFSGVTSEVKFGLWPLVFGTIKATFYAMLFGAPLALFAAIYTSEFLSPRVRGRVKPLIEMMASLPSVVLGFFAALVIAPVVERVVPATLLVFFTVPAAYLLGSFLWQLIPHDRRIACERYRLGAIFLMMGLGMWTAYELGPLVEWWLFAGDIKLWLDGQVGTGTGGWMLVLLPLSAAVVGVATVLGTNTWLRGLSGNWSRTQFAAVGLLKFLLVALAAVLLALALSGGLTAAGFDPRGTFIDTYQQRNSLIVGVIMGFAIIPIIYTISEDALSTVPMHLRFASLGAGATPWQTAIRVVVPTAMSGLFSALMIGLGRAVGETMIVLMAAGNTSIVEWNIFNGFRTLSANIAVELPEAVVGDSHYRTLFFAALVLFVMTFAVNTVAELVRIRFRRRAIQL